MSDELVKRGPGESRALVVREIPLRARDGTVRAIALVDADDFDWLSRWRWHLTPQGYAARGITRSYKRHSILMHREILGLPIGEKRQGDHIDRDRLNNTRANLRIVAGQAEQLQNVPARGGFRGVSQWTNGAYTYWRARVQHEGRTYNLGYFKNEREAAEAAASFRRQHMPHATD